MKSEKGCWIGSGRWIVMICLGEEPHQFLAYGIQDTNFDQQDVFFCDHKSQCRADCDANGGSDLSSQSLTTNPTIRCTLDRKQATGFWRRWGFGCTQRGCGEISFYLREDFFHEWEKSSFWMIILPWDILPFWMSGKNMKQKHITGHYESWQIGILAVQLQLLHPVQ